MLSLWRDEEWCISLCNSIYVIMVTINMTDASVWLNISVNFIFHFGIILTIDTVCLSIHIYCYKSYLLLLLLWQNSHCESALVPWLFSYHPSCLYSVKNTCNIFLPSNSPLTTPVSMCSNQGQQHYFVLHHHNSIPNNVHIIRTKYYAWFETQNILTVRELT
jgi:hypothetical protein